MTGGPTRRRLRLQRHRGTTAHVAGIYPFSVQSGLGHRGVYVGTDVLTGGGGFCWDPFEAYDQHLTTNPNTWVLGEPGNGKSALIKSLLYRMAGIWGLGPDGRFLAICDPKGEYRILAEHLGLPVVALAPGGGVRVNPLDSGPLHDAHDVDARVLHQAAMVNALIATVLSRTLTPFEDAAVFAVIDHLARRPDRATLADVAALLTTPTREIAQRINRPPAEVASGCEAIVFGLDKLLTRSLRGMFDGPSTITVNWDGPGLVVDLSAVHHDPDALPLGHGGGDGVAANVDGRTARPPTGPGPRRSLVSARRPPHRQLPAVVLEAGSQLRRGQHRGRPPAYRPRRAGRRRHRHGQDRRRAAGRHRHQDRAPSSPRPARRRR